MASSVESSKPYRAVIYLTRKPDMSPEDFHEYWSEKHAPIFLGTAIAQRNLLKYTQYHFNCPLMTKVAQQGFPILDSFDGAAEFVAKDVSSLMEIFKDPEYLEKVVPDGKKFIGKAGQFAVGHEEVKLDRTR